MTREHVRTPQRRGVSRRTVTRGAAWSVPAVVVASAAPAIAASGPSPTNAVGTACKLPGNSAQGCADVFAGLPGLNPDKAFAIPLLVTNNTYKAIVLKSSISISSSGLPFTVVGIVPAYCTSIAPGASVKIIVYANSDNSANQGVTLSMTVPWGHDCDDTDHAPVVVPGVSIPAFPPCSSRVPFPTGSPTCDPPFYQST
ncbi:hypothetical protein GCM10009721_40720 [Terrabacter tumescens]|uniref:Uncharacterized protein n=1 Tax=Terrabacter tumescens TaxID=60443 RepID=A0ABQ2IJN0_9MICO|nr:hypothetical protein [Terrabacter tumescens]GGN08728.1 hypothetical protein GCM10009721_40720 [Terrabacter tumescens]